MSPEEARALLAAPVTFERRSIFWACTQCKALLFNGDQDQHRRMHRALAVALGDGGGRP